MILTNNMIINGLSEYSNPKTKLGRLVKSGNFFPIIRGLYETDINKAGYLLAESIYSPSYLSFDFALSFYGLIPETVYSYTSATFEKRKKKIYNTSFGNFYYRDVPSDVFYLEVISLHEDKYYFKIASPEKALCDKLYTVAPVRSLKRIAELLEDDLRIDYSELEKLNIEIIEEISPLYHSSNVTLLAKFLRKNFQ